MTVPGIGPLIATALAVLAPPPETFRRGRDFAAWPGLTPRQHSTGGKQRLGATTKMGERSLRRLLIRGANSVIIKRHVHARARPGTWLAVTHVAQAAAAGAGGLGEQDGPDRVGVDDEGRGLPGSGRGGVSQLGREDVGAEEGKERYGKGRWTGSGEPVRNRVPPSTPL